MLTVLLLRSLLSFKFKSTHGIVPLPALHHVTPLPSARTALPWAFLEIFYLSLVIWNWPFVHSLFQSGNSPLLFLGGVLILFLNNTLFSICSVCFPQLMFRTFSLLVFYSLLWNISSSLSSNPSVEVFDYTVFGFFFSFWEHILVFWFALDCNLFLLDRLCSFSYLSDNVWSCFFCSLHWLFFSPNLFVLICFWLGWLTSSHYIKGISQILVVFVSFTF